MTNEAGERVAEDVAARAALRVGSLPGTFRALISERTVAPEAYRRVAYQIEHRTVVLRLAPAIGVRKPELGSIPRADRIDPWSVDVRSLPSATRTAAMCPSCEGSKKRACSACAGGGRVGCSGCGGGGRVQGQRGPKNCPSCRGRGDVKCPACRAGRVPCEPCGARGRVYAWLEIQASHSVQMKLSPRDDVGALHTDADDPADLDRDPGTYEVPLVADSGWMGPDVDGFPPELRETVDPGRDRVLRVRIQRFETPVHSLHYATRVGEGTIRVAGSPPRVLGGSTWGPLQRKTLLGVAAGAFAGLAGVMVLGAYLGRASWFVEHGNGGWIALLTLGACFGSTWLAHTLLMRKPVRGRWRVEAPALALATTGVLMALAWFTGGPTAQSVATALDRADLEAAREELEALAVVGADEEAYSALRERVDIAEREEKRRDRERRDKTHLASVEARTGAIESAKAARGIWHEPEYAQRGTAVARQRGEAELAAALRAEDAEALGRLAQAFAELDLDFARRVARRASLVTAEACRRKADFACAKKELTDWDPKKGSAETADEHRRVLELTLADLKVAISEATATNGDLDQRKTALEQGVLRVAIYTELTDVPPPTTTATLHKALHKVDKAIAKQQAKVRATEARKQQMAARAAKRAQQAAARRERRSKKASTGTRTRSSGGGGRVSCCDGTTSPSCHYGGSLRGCCSHHGGVC